MRNSKIDSAAHPFHRWLPLLAKVWCVATLAVAAYAVLKPTTTAADLKGLPTPWVQWLDQNYDFRTFVMTVAICSLPTLLFAGANKKRNRRQLLAAIMVVSIGLEFCQLGIPTRSFSWQDIAYTIAAVLFCETLILLLGYCFSWGSGSSARKTVILSPTSVPLKRLRIAQAKNRTFGTKAVISVICLVLMVIQFFYVFMADSVGRADPTRSPAGLGDDATNRRGLQITPTTETAEEPDSTGPMAPNAS